MKPTMANLRRYAERIGATIDESSIDFGHICVDAPRGQVWMCDRIHGLAVHWETDSAGRACPKEWKDDAIEDVIDRMEYGLEDCTDADCEICNEH